MNGLTRPVEKYCPSKVPTRNEPLTSNYTIHGDIGRGKYAVVRRCTHNETGQEVAAKFIRKRRQGKSSRDEILREVVMLEAALSHQRWVQLLEVYETQSEFILVTEYCSGGELFDECVIEESFKEEDVVRLLRQILEGLVYLHDKHIVHLDLKPQNILLTRPFPHGEIKICDMGFACPVNTGKDVCEILGTTDYIAPEVLNFEPLGIATDMWSLGVLTYVMLTACSPFKGDNEQETYVNIIRADIDFPTELFCEISPLALDFMEKVIIKEPKKRWTARQCLSHPWLEGESIPNTLDISTPDIDVGVTDTDLRDNDIEKRINGDEDIDLDDGALDKSNLDASMSEQSFSGNKVQYEQDVDNCVNNDQLTPTENETNKTVIMESAEDHLENCENTKESDVISTDASSKENALSSDIEETCSQDIPFEDTCAHSSRECSAEENMDILTESIKIQRFRSDNLYVQMQNTVVINNVLFKEKPVIVSKLTHYIDGNNDGCSLKDTVHVKYDSKNTDDAIVPNNEASGKRTEMEEESGSGNLCKNELHVPIKRARCDRESSMDIDHFQIRHNTHTTHIEFSSKSFVNSAKTHIALKDQNYVNSAKCESLLTIENGHIVLEDNVGCDSVV